MIEARPVYSANDIRTAKSFKAARDMILANFANPITSRLWLIRGLMAIYQRQTELEKETESTLEHNGVGFSSFDDRFLSGMARQVIEFEAGRSKYGSPLSPRQFMVLRQRMEKYAMQLARIARPVPARSTSVGRVSGVEDIDDEV